jgi:hypothetical protein
MKHMSTNPFDACKRDSKKRSLCPCSNEDSSFSAILQFSHAFELILWESILLQNYLENSRFDPFCATPYYLAFDALPEDLQALDRYLLHVLVSCADRGWVKQYRIDGVAICPGLKLLASRSSLDGRTVQRALNRLADRRLILIVEGQSHASGSQNNTYFIAPTAFVLHAEKIAAAAIDELRTEDRPVEFKRIGKVSRQVQRDLAKLSRLPGRTTWDELERYQNIFARLKRRIVEFQDRFGENGGTHEAADLDHDSGPGGGVAQSRVKRILRDPDLRISGIEGLDPDLKISRSILTLRFFIDNKKILTNGWMESKSARARVIGQAKDTVNSESDDHPKITPQVVSIAKDFQQCFASRYEFIDWSLLNHWVADMLSKRGLDYTLQLAAWTDQLWQSRERRPIRLSYASLKTLAQMFEEAHKDAGSKLDENLSRENHNTAEKK